MSNIIISDTNIILKLMLFSGVDLTQLDYPTYGKLKFHPFVQEEIAIWKDAHSKKGKHKKIDKFGLAFVEQALEISKNLALQEVIIPSQLTKDASFAQYRKQLRKINSNSADPSDNDWLLLFHAEVNDCYMATCDESVFKVGRIVIGQKSIKLEHLLIDLYETNVITAAQVIAYFDKISPMNEWFDLGVVLNKRR